MKSDKQELIEWNAISSSISKARTIQDMNSLRSKIEAMRILSKQSKQSLETQNKIAEFRLRVDRKRGLWLTEHIEIGGEGTNQHVKKEQKSERYTLAKIGIAKAESSVLQKLARIPEEEFESYLKTAQEGKQEVTTIGLLRVSKPLERLYREQPIAPRGRRRRGTDTIYLGDCLDVLPTLPAKSVSFIVADPPYGSTACAWDEVIPFKPLWKELNRVIKDDGVIAIFGTEPFSSYLRLSNIESFKYDLIWDKGKGSNPLLAKKRPMASHEVISIFGGNRYYPQMKKGKPYNAPKTGGNHSNRIIGNSASHSAFQQEDNPLGLYYPTSILSYPIHCGSKLHPTEKPVKLIEYLIRTYSEAGEIILDFCAGSGTTGIAAMNAKRSYILIEKDKRYFKLMEKRLSVSGGE